MFAPGVKERRKPPETSLEKSHRRRPRQPATTSLLNDVRSPARRLAWANAHRLLSCESELRIRSCGFPPDLRVSGARQRILRLSTPVETSRPPRGDSHSTSGRGLPSNDSVCWSCWAGPGLTCPSYDPHNASPSFRAIPRCARFGSASPRPECFTGGPAS